MKFLPVSPDMLKTFLPGWSLEQLQYVRVMQALEDYKWNRTHTAPALDISLRTLRTYVKELRAAGFTVPTKPTP